MPTRARVYISFDYDNDDDLRTLLIGQSKNEDSPFSIADASIPAPVTGDWKASARRRIKGADVVAVICGQRTDTATGVAVEVTIAQEEGVPYFLLRLPDPGPAPCGLGRGRAPAADRRGPPPV
jgi:hypothetical protein